MYQDQGREIWCSGGVLQLPAKANIQTYKLLSSWIRTHFAAGCGYDAPERTRDWVSCQTVNPVVEWKETDFYLQRLPVVTRQSKQRQHIPLQRKSHVKTKTKNTVYKPACPGCRLLTGWAAESISFPQSYISRRIFNFRLNNQISPAYKAAIKNAARPKIW